MMKVITVIFCVIFLSLFPLTTASNRMCYYIQEESGRKIYLQYNDGAIFGRDSCDSKWEIDGTKFKTKTGFFCCKKYLGINQPEPGSEIDTELVGKGDADDSDTWREEDNGDGTVSIRSQYLYDNYDRTFYVTAVSQPGQDILGFELVEQEPGAARTNVQKFYMRG